MFGLTEEQIAEFGLTFGLGGFMLFMLFIIWDLAKESKAGRLGTFVLFFVLSFGMLFACVLALDCVAVAQAPAKTTPSGPGKSSRLPNA